MPFPETRPSFFALHVDATAHIRVIGNPRPDSDRPVAAVFDAEGRLLGMLELPPGLAVHGIGTDWLLGTARDEPGVEYVRLYRLDRGVGG